MNALESASFVAVSGGKEPASISVVVPAYNVQEYVGEALDSLLAQTQPFYEIIVVDDGSTDDTPLILSHYAQFDAVRVITTQNQGLGRARNEGMRQATGDFIYFFDSDDLLHPEFVASMTREIARHPRLDAVFFSGEVFIHPGYDAAHYLQADKHEFSRRFTAEFACGLDAFVAMRRAGPFSPSACLYLSRRALWGPGMEFLPILHEDNDAAVRLCMLAGATSVTIEPFFRRRLRNGSTMTSQPSARNLAGYVEAFRSTLLVYRTLACENHRRAVRGQLHDMAWMYLHTCKRGQMTPEPSVIRYFIRHGQQRVVARFWRLFVPMPVRKMARSLRRVRQNALAGRS